MSGLILKNIFVVKCCFLCEQRRVANVGNTKIVRCAMNEKRISERQETRINGQPEWCPKKREALIRGGKK